MALSKGQWLRLESLKAAVTAVEPVNSDQSYPTDDDILISAEKFRSYIDTAFGGTKAVDESEEVRVEVLNLSQKVHRPRDKNTALPTEETIISTAEAFEGYVNYSS